MGTVLHEAPATIAAAHETTPVVRFTSLELAQATSLAKRRGGTFFLSLVLHAILACALVVVPLLSYDWLPATGEHVTHAFFVQPLELAPAPPPPPPPPAAARRLEAHPTPRPPRVDSTRLVAPVKVPDVVPVPEESLDLGLGAQGGVPGGVEGGVPGGVVGGIIGGLPPPPPPPPRRRVVRIGGDIVAPALVQRVAPVYPKVAEAARVQGIVILEARVGTRGRVESVKVLRGVPLLDEAALEAVRQWRYRPLLLNGEPTEFLLSVTVNFQLK